MMEIRRVDRYVFDIFFGTQWDQWSRVRRGRNNTFVVAGNKLSPQMLNKLDGVLEPDLPTPVGNNFNLA